MLLLGQMGLHAAVLHRPKGEQQCWASVSLAWFHEACNHRQRKVAAMTKMLVC